MKRSRRKSQDIINILVRYRNIFVDRITWLWMWLCESFNLFALYTSRDLWDKFHLWICYIKNRLILDNREKQKLLEWVKSSIAANRRPSLSNRRFSECFYENTADFSKCWCDGILLCALIESLVPGSCPRYDLLNPDHKWDNVRLALKLIEKKIGIKPEITIEEIIDCKPKTEKKIACLLAQIKVASTKLKARPIINRPDDDDADSVVFDVEQECLARGMGLSVAVTGRQARFNIFLKSISNLNIVIEIKGPNGSLCSERITNRSPKRKNSVELNKIDKRKIFQKQFRNIPFEYEVYPGKIRVGYTPVECGQHRLSIIWQGQHIMGSPYTVNVDNTLCSEDSIKLKKSKEFLRVENCYRPSNNDTKVCDSLQVIDAEKPFRPKFGAVTKKRVLRHIMVVDGKEMVIETDSDDIPTVLKKMTKNSSICENNENSVVTQSNECNSKNSEFKAHYPSPCKNKMVSTPPGLTTVLEGIDQTDFNLKVHNVKARKSCKTANTTVSDKKDRNILYLNKFTTLSRNENILNLNEDLVITEIKSNEIPKELKLEENECHYLDNELSDPLKSNDSSSLNCLSEVNSRISELPTEGNSNNEFNINFDLIKLEAPSPLKIETESVKAFKAIKKLSEDLQCEKSDDTDSKFIKNAEYKEINSSFSDNSVEISVEKLQENCNENEDGNKDLKIFKENEEALEENEFYCLPILQESKENAFLTESNCKVSTIDFQNDFHTEKNITKIVSVNPSPTIEFSEKIQEPIRKISYHKLFKATKYEGNLVKNKVQEWERTMNKISNQETKETPIDEQIKPSSPILISVRSRKEFWENGCQIPKEPRPRSESDCDVGRKDVIRTQNPDRSASFNTTYPLHLIKNTLDKSTQVDLDDFIKTNTIKTNSNYPTETPDSEDSGICDYQRSLAPNITRKLSPSAYRHRFYPNHSHLSPTEESISSDLTDAASANTDWDRGFIDDEIPDYANLLLDNYVSFTGLLNTERPISRRELLRHDILSDDEREFLKEPSTPKPERCRIFGTGVYYGQVCLRNHFQVRTKGTGPGYLTVNIQGAGKHDVTEMTIIYSGNELYDILYEVSQPGYYIISIKWGDLNIPESPYICNITY